MLAKIVHGMGKINTKKLHNILDMKEFYAISFTVMAR